MMWELKPLEPITEALVKTACQHCGDKPLLGLLYPHYANVHMAASKTMLLSCYCRYITVEVDNQKIAYNDWAVLTACHARLGIHYAKEPPDYHRLCRREAEQQREKREKELQRRNLRARRMRYLWLSVYAASLSYYVPKLARMLGWWG